MTGTTEIRVNLILNIQVHSKETAIQSTQWMREETADRFTVL